MVIYLHLWDTHHGRIILEEADESQSDLLGEFKNLMIKQDQKHSSIDK